jgi:hypothetical protein
MIKNPSKKEHDSDLLLMHKLWSLFRVILCHVVADASRDPWVSNVDHLESSVS